MTIIFQPETTAWQFYGFVRLPEGCSESNMAYPANYLPDGGATFPMLAFYDAMMTVDEPMHDAITVGIAEGAVLFEAGHFHSSGDIAPTAKNAARKHRRTMRRRGRS